MIHGLGGAGSLRDCMKTGKCNKEINVNICTNPNATKHLRKYIKEKPKCI